MYNTRIVSLLLLVSNNLSNLNRYLASESDSSIYIKLENINSGNDQRYDINNGEYNYNDRVNTTMLGKIKRNMINKNIIEELESTNINIHKKLDIIEKYTDIYKNCNQITGFNLFAGNLLNIFYDGDVDKKDDNNDLNNK
jgi:hypothetical protein